MPNVPKEECAAIATDSFMSPLVSDPTTFGFRWDDTLVTRRETKAGSLLILPEYYHLVKDDNDRTGKWVAVAAEEVPLETGLARVSLAPDGRKPPKPYVTPDDALSCWKKPAPAARPLEARPCVASALTYYSHPLPPQPAFLIARLTPL